MIVSVLRQLQQRPASAPVVSHAGLPERSLPVAGKVSNPERITALLMQHIEAGEMPWQQPSPTARALPRFATPGERALRGVNTVILAAKGYADPRWMTREQIARAGWHVREGQQSVPVFLWETRKATADAGAFPVLHRWSVFNGTQIHGIPEFVAPRPAADEALRRDIAPIVEMLGIDVQTSSAGAPGYIPAIDAIRVRPRQEYASELAYQADVLNGVLSAVYDVAIVPRSANGRVDIGMDGESVSIADVSRRVLRMELARAMLGMRLGIALPSPTPVANGPLLDVLRKDKREAMNAGGDAERLVRYVMSFHPDVAPVLREEMALENRIALDADGDVLFDASDFAFYEPATPYQP